MTRADEVHITKNKKKTKVLSRASAVLIHIVQYTIIRGAS